MESRLSFALQLNSTTMERLLHHTFGVFFLLLLLLPASAQQGKGAALINEDKPGTGKVHGLIIGINAYQDFPALQYANADALNFYRLLLSPSIGADSNHVVLLLNEKATSPNVYEALENLVTFAKAGDRVFIYFSGHGDVEKTTVQQFGFLVTYDTPKKMVMRNSLDVNHLNAYVSTLSLKNKADVFLITDACRSGRINESNTVDYTYLAQTLGGKTADEVRILSSQSNQLSYEGVQWGQGRGLFSYVLTNGLAGTADIDGDSIVTLYELNLYLMQEVPKLAKPNKQMPIVMGPQDMAISKRSAINGGNSSQVLTAMADLGGRGYEDLYIDSLSAQQRTDYDSLLACITANRLQKPTGKSARAYYEKLVASGLPEAFNLLVTRKLIAALQKRGQEVLHNLIVLDENSNRSYKLDGEIASNLKYSADLLGKEHYLYQPTLAKYYYFLSYTYYLKDRYAEDDSLLNLAISAVNKAIAIDSTVAEFWRVKGLYLGMQYRELESLKAKLKALSLAPERASLYVAAGFQYAILKDYNRALSYLDTAILKDPDNPLSYSSVAYVYKQQAKHEEALKWIDKALALDSNSYANFWVTKGELLNRLGRHQEAMACYSTAIAVEPRHKLWYQVKASAFNDYLHDYKSGLLYLDSALLLAPDDELLLQGKALTYWRLGEGNEGIEVIDKALRLPKQQYSFLSHGIKGSLYGSLGLYEEALKQYDTALLLNPDYDTHLDKAQVLILLRRFNEALLSTQKALQINPNNANAYLSRSSCYVGLKRYEDAIAAFDKAVQLGAAPTFTDYYNIGCSYSLLNNQKQALAYLEKSIQTGWKDFDWIDKDTDWNNIRETAGFKTLIAKYKK